MQYTDRIQQARNMIFDFADTLHSKMGPQSDVSVFVNDCSDQRVFSIVVVDPANDADQFEDQDTKRKMLSTLLHEFYESNQMIFVKRTDVFDSRGPFSPVKYFMMSVTADPRSAPPSSDNPHVQKLIKDTEQYQIGNAQGA